MNSSDIRHGLAVPPNPVFFWLAGVSGHLTPACIIIPTWDFSYMRSAVLRLGLMTETIPHTQPVSLEYVWSYRVHLLTITHNKQPEHEMCTVYQACMIYCLIWTV